MVMMNEWITRTEVAGRMHLDLVTQAVELEELLSGLPRQPSRFPHMRGKPQWDEYWWSKANGSDETDETTKQAVVQSKDKMTAQEASSAHASLMDAPGKLALIGGCLWVWGCSCKSYTQEEEFFAIGG